MSPRPLWLFGGAALAGMLLAMLSVGAYLMLFGGRKDDQTAVPSPAQNPADNSAVSQRPIEPPTASPPASAPVTTVPSPSVAPLIAPTAAASAPVATPAVPKTDRPTPNPADLAADLNPASGPAKPEVKSPPDVVRPPVEPRPVARHEPPKISPAAKPTIPAAGDPRPSARPEESPQKPAASDLSQFDKFLDDSTIPVGPESSRPISPPSVASARPPAPRIRPTAKKVDVAARLADPLVALDYPKIRLADFVHLLTDLSTVPITIDPAALAPLRLTTESELSIKEENTSVGQALASATKSLGLAYVVEDSQVRIIRPQPDGKLRRVRYDLSDLAALDAASLELFSQLLREWNSPGSWDGAGGAGTLQIDAAAIVVEQSDDVHFQNLELIEKLRIARGLKPKSRLAPALLRLETPDVLARPKLDTPLTLTIIRPTRLTQILSAIRAKTGLRLIVDWQGLAEVQWSPTNSESTFSSRAEPLSAALDRWLGEMDLAWRAIDENTLVITSAAALPRHRELGLYPLADSPAGKNPAQFLSQIKRKLGSEALLYYDAPSKHLVVQASPAIHVQVRRMLAEPAAH